MRACLLLTVPLLVAALVAAAPAPPPSPPPVRPGPQAEAEAFAQHLVNGANLIVLLYIRPVSRADLLDAALVSLYQHARRPVPRDLRRRIDQAEKAAAALAAAVPDPVPPPGIMPVVAPPRRPIATDDRPVIDLVRRIREEVGRADALQGQDPLFLCCQAMTRTLDPYSGVVPLAEMRRNVGLSSERDGFGLEVPDTAGSGRVIVKEVLPGGPAQRAGLRPGDEITRLRCSDSDLKLHESLSLLNGQSHSPVPAGLGSISTSPPQPIQVTFRRPGRKDPCTVTLAWEHFRPETVLGVMRRDDNSWDWWLDPDKKIAHIRLASFDHGTDEELRAVVAELVRDGMRGLILDLRWTPGGFLDEAVRSTELFLGEGTIATLKGRDEERVFRSTNEGKLRGFPMAVLINAETSGGAELMAAALQDHHRAVLVGQRTRGKGSVQQARAVGAMSQVGIKVTTGAFHRPSGKNLHRFPDSKPEDDWGVHPDSGHEFRLSADLQGALKKWWQLQTLRPGSSRERLPLDDPLTDTSRQAALESLTELLADSH